MTAVAVDQDRPTRVGLVTGLTFVAALVLAGAPIGEPIRELVGAPPAAALEERHVLAQLERKIASSTTRLNLRAHRLTPIG